jgi:hypothetical protein
MEETSKQAKIDCSAGCSHCGGGDICPPEGAMHGWRLTFSAVAVFLLPLGLAAGGAALVGTDGAGQFAAAMIGLVVGIVGGIVATRWIRRGSEDAA